jgi:hypothetical protein
MQQVMTAVSAHKSPVHPPPAAATVADVMRPPVTTVSQHDHVAAAAYLMKHAGTSALLVLDAQAGEPVGIITAADVARAIADGKDVNDVWVAVTFCYRTDQSFCQLPSRWDRSPRPPGRASCGRALGVKATAM